MMRFHRLSFTAETEGNLWLKYCLKPIQANNNLKN